LIINPKFNSCFPIKSLPNVLKWAQVIAVIACDEHPCLAPHEISQPGRILVQFLFSLYSIAVFCKIWEVFDKKWEYPLVCCQMTHH
jgi:hypothetical protein